MKKFIYLISLLLLPLSVISCDKADGPTPDDSTPDTPDSLSLAVTAGAYVLCQGNFYNGIDGGLFSIDFANSSIVANAFKTANNRSLGDTPQCGICYGSKIYIGVYASNTIEIIDKNTFKSVKQISLSNSTTGSQPRSVVADNGKLYFSMYDGYVCRMDTTSLELEASVKVGPNPEIIGIYDNKIYVPNSDGMSYPNYGKTASIVDLDTFTATTIQCPENPYQFEANNDGLFLLAKGNYSDVASAVYKYAGSEFVKIADATIMALDYTNIYLVNAPYFGESSIEYKIYDTKTGNFTDWNITGIDYPSNVMIDKTGRRILVSSYIMNGQYPSYDAPGYLCQFSMENSLIKKYTIGTGPTSIFFNYE